MPPEEEEVDESVEEAAEEANDETGSETPGDDEEGGDENEEEDSEGDEGDEEEARGEEGGDEPEHTAPIPVKTYLGYKKKWKGREVAFQQEIEGLKAEVAKGGQSNVDPEKYKQVTGYLGNLQEAAQKFPWLSDQLAALEKGIEPDWRAVHQTLDAHVKALPGTDPRTQAMLHQQQKVLDGLQFQNQKVQFREKRTDEDAQIKSIYKDVADEGFFGVLNQMTENVVKAMPENAFVAPDRVAMAKALMNWRKADRARLVKSQKAGAQKAKGAKVVSPKGKIGKTVKEPPGLGTAEGQKWFEDEVRKEVAAQK